MSDIDIAIAIFDPSTVPIKFYITTKCPARQSRNQSSEYLPQRREGRKGRRIRV